MTEFYGSIFPFARTAQERAGRGDRRLSIAERYAGREQYVKQARAAAARLVDERFLLPRDVEFAVERAARLWDALAQ